MQPAGQRHRDLARDRGCDRRLDAHAGPARVLAAGGVEQDPLRAGLEPRAGTGDHDLGIVARTDLERLPDGPPRLSDGRRRLVAAQLDGIGIDGSDDVAKGVGTNVGGDDDDARARGARRGGGPGEAGERRSLLDRQLAGRPGREVEPDGVGASADGGQDPGLVRHAADLHERGAGVGRDVARVASGGDERPGGGGRICRAHQRLADERGVEPGRAPAGDGRRVPHAGLRDRQAVARDQLAQPHGLLRVHLERPEVAVVDPDEPGVRAQRRLDLPRVVRLHQRLEAEVPCLRRQPGEPRRRMEHREEQDEIGPGSPEEVELPGIDDEVLGEHGDGDRRRGRPGGRRPSRRTSGARTGRR